MDNTLGKNSMRTVLAVYVEVHFVFYHSIELGIENRGISPFIEY